jgi:CheY-like chemotaxis protein
MPGMDGFEITQILEDGEEIYGSLIDFIYKN